MYALIFLLVLAADPPGPTPAPCPPPKTPREVAWDKLAAANAEWFKFQKIADDKAQIVATKRKALVDQTARLQGEIDGAVSVSTSAASDANVARKALADAGNAYADIVYPDGAVKKPVQIDPPAKKISPPPPPAAPKADNPSKRELYWAHASWCQPCRELQPTIESLQRKGYKVSEFNLESGSGDVIIEGTTLHIDQIPQMYIVAGHGENAVITRLPPGKHGEDYLESLLK